MVVAPDLKLEPGSPSAVSGLSVRLVDDHGDVAQAIRPLLEAGGIEVIASGIPDVLLVCLRMGGMLEQRPALSAAPPTRSGVRSRRAIWLTLRERQVLVLLVEGASNNHGQAGSPLTAGGSYTGNPPRAGESAGQPGNHQLG
jgi:hypothetical protein